MSKKQKRPRAKKQDKESPDITAYKKFAREFVPFEWTNQPKSLAILVDGKSDARFCECHIQASKLVPLATTDVPLDPEEQAEYRANRELVTSADAFARMKEDALAGRVFSNIVAEYTREFDPSHPLKIIGGQHRFEAVKLALAKGVDAYHGVKVYLNLNMTKGWTCSLFRIRTLEFPAIFMIACRRHLKVQNFAIGVRLLDSLQRRRTLQIAVFAVVA